MPDFLEPTTWTELVPHEHQLYLDDMAQTWVVLDQEDYQYFSQWKWHTNKPHHSRNGSKQYAVRTQGRGGNYRPKLYLHVEIMKRTGAVPPSLFHTLVDHRNGNEFDCRRANLRWATPEFNGMNKKGALADLEH